MFTRDFWRRNPFPDANMAIDTRLLWNSNRKQILALPDERFYVGMIHGGNTSPKNTGHGLWCSHSLADVEALLGADLQFYREAFSDDQRTAAA
jgi:hypothetical protein